MAIDVLTMPKTLTGRICATLLCGVILYASGAVGLKAARNAHLSQRWAWQETTDRFTGAPVDKVALKKYTEPVPHEKTPVTQPVTAKFKATLMADSPMCITSHTSGGNMWGFALTCTNLDGIHLGAVPTDTFGVNVSGTAAGGSATMQFVKAANNSGPGSIDPPVDWSTAEKAAWDAWAAGLPETFDIATGFLYSATVTAPGDTQTIYKCFGYTQGDSTAWAGDTEWSLSGTFSITNLRLRLKCTETTGSIYTVPRRWHHRGGVFGWYTETDPASPTTATATLGEMSVSGVIDMDPDPVTGEVDIDTSPINPASFFSYVTVSGITVATATDYGTVGPITCTSEGVSPNCYNSFYSTDAAPTDPSDWTATTTEPSGATWHAFNSGTTMTIQRLGGNSTASFGWHTWMRGPVKVVLEVGRGGYLDTFPVADGWRADLGVIQYTNDAGTEYDTVWFGAGESGWLVTGMTTTSVDARGLWTGALAFGNIGGSVDNAYLVSSGELCEAGEEDTPLLDNSGVKMLLPSLQDPLSGLYWGPVLTLVHEDISADIPPGETARPTLWTAGTGASIDGTYNERWTITGATATISRTLASRYEARLGYLATGYEVGDTAYIDDWIMVATANWLLASDPAEVAAVCDVEDVTNYDNSRCLCFTFADGYPTGLPANWQAEATLKLYFSNYTFTDECYTPAEYDGINLRFGSDGFFEFEQSDSSFTFTGEKLTTTDETTGLKFDLAQMRRVKGLDLRHVTQVELTLPTGEFRLADMRLQKDPDDHGAGEDYPDLIPQPATDPWNWLACGTGFGLTMEGVPCCNVPEGTESTPFSEDIQLGIKQTQYLQWNPLWLAAQEEPPTYDPTYARNLNVRLVQLIQRQEQLSGSYLNAATVAAACTDEDSNSLGFLYPWDLQRQTSDDPSLYGGIHGATLNAASAPLAPVIMRGVWITHGRAQGIAYQGGKFIRDEGGAFDSTTEGRSMLYRRALDESGTPTGAWEACGSMTPEVTGRWVSPPAAEAGYIYGTKQTIGETDPTSTSNFVTREYADLYCWFPDGKLCYVVRDAAGHPTWLACVEGDAVNAYTLIGDGTATLWPEGVAPAAMTGDYRFASLRVHGDGSLLIAATNITESRIDVARSRDAGVTWEAVNTAFGTGLVNGTLFGRGGSDYLVGYNSTASKVYLVGTSQADLTREELDGTNTLIEVCAYTVGTGEDPPICSGDVEEDGRIVVAVAGPSDTTLYGSRNLIDGFDEIT